jgi:hypothetical protein
VVVLLLLVPFAAGNWDGMRDALPLRARELQAFRYLQRSDVLEGPVIGFGAVYSGRFLAMRTLYRSPHADAAFKQLIRSGTTAGQLYGLIGVRRTDPLYFAAVAHRYASSVGTVRQSAGCTEEGVPIGGLVRTESSIQLARTETVQQWWDRHRHLSNAPVLDIAGGAMSSMYFDRGGWDEKQVSLAMRTYDFSE